MENLLSLFPRFLEMFGPQALRVVAALALLLAGFVLARAVGWLVTKGLGKTTLDNRLAAWIGGESAKAAPIELWVGKFFYFVVLLFALVMFFNTLELNVVGEPILTLLNKVFGYAPQLLGGAVLTGIAWLLASLARRGTALATSKWRLDETLSEKAGTDDEAARKAPLAKTLGEGVYYLVFLLFLPNILGVLGLQGLLEPVQSMMDRLLAFLPNILAAGVILAVGWFVARIVQRIVSNLLSAIGADDLGKRLGLGTALGTTTLSGLCGLVVYVFILFNVLLSALNALDLDAVTRPASEMLGNVMEAVPLLFAAGILLTLAFFVGRLVSGLLSNVLAGAGFDSILHAVGLAPPTPLEGSRRPSAVAGSLLLTAIMLFAAIEASGLLGFEHLAGLLTGLLEFAAQVFVGVLILGIGLFLGNLAAKAIRSSASAHTGLISKVARIAILSLSGAMALRQMGLANEIIELAFGLVLGALAVAAAIAFGLGGRDLAAKELAAWRRGLGAEE
jgi:hypothetical protein